MPNSPSTVHYINRWVEGQPEVKAYMGDESDVAFASCVIPQDHFFDLADDNHIPAGFIAFANVLLASNTQVTT